MPYNIERYDDTYDPDVIKSEAERMLRSLGLTRNTLPWYWDGNKMIMKSTGRILAVQAPGQLVTG